MYIPKSFENKDLEQMHQLMEKYNFATLISYAKDNFQVSHLPLILKRNEGQYGILAGHFAKQNPHANLIDNENNKVLCIFHGPHAYISPTWYKSYPSVPTWNYVVVHAYGKLDGITQEELSKDLKQLTSQQEFLLKERSHYVIPSDYQNKLMEHIVGFKIEILHIEGKYKLGQNRSFEDQAGMLQGLFNENTNESIMLANFIKTMRETIQNNQDKDNRSLDE